jgi:hypothetical protein
VTAANEITHIVAGNILGVVEKFFLTVFQEQPDRTVATD